MKMNANPVRGTKDFLPLEVELRDYVRGKIEESYKSFGFNKINVRDKDQRGPQSLKYILPGPLQKKCADP